MPAYWLVKSEPDVFGWDQQVENNVEPWTGVRNHMARQNLEAMKMGDLAFFYHSNIGKEIVGVVQVVRQAYPDPSAEPPKTLANGSKAKAWMCVDMRAIAPMLRPVTLAEIKADPALSELALVKFSRLSVAPVSAQHWAYICKLGGYTAAKPSA